MFIIVYSLANLINTTTYFGIFAEAGLLYILGIVIYSAIVFKLNLVPDYIKNRIMGFIRWD